MSFEETTVFRRVHKRAFPAEEATPRHKVGKKKGKCRNADRTPLRGAGVWWEPRLHIGVRSISQTL